MTQNNQPTTRAASSAACPACLAADLGEIVYAVNGFGIERCNACGLGRTIIPEGFNSLTIYDESYFQGGQPDGYSDYKGSQDVLRREFRSIIKELGRVGARSGRLLDVGCAYGYFLDEAKSSFDVVGLEVCADAVRCCQSRGLQVYEGVADQATMNAIGEFDVITMLDVIEHVPDPAACIRTLASSLRSGGVLLLTTGDWSSLSARVFGPKWRLMTPPQHLFFFSPKTLTLLLERSGFEVLSIAHPWKTVPLGLAFYQLGRRTGLPIKPLEKLTSFGVPLNLFDAVRVVARRN